MRLSVSSKIWREVCSSLQCLNLDLSDFGWQLTNLTDDASLENFVNVVLQYYDTTRLNVFHLICRDKYLEKFALSFITEVTKFNPRIVNLDVPISYTNTFSSIFTCKSVEDLHLTCQLRRGILATPEVVTLLNLKKLCLTDAVIGGESFSKLLSGCPVIEDLSLKNCIISGDGIVSNKTLKFLSWDGWSYFFLTICAPNLKSLEYTSSGNITTLVNLSSLVFARTLLDEELTKLPKFHNLKSLSLNGWCMACHSGPVAWFLENSLNLENLTVCLDRQHCLVKNKRNHHNLRQMEAPRCKKLKKLVIRVLKGYKKAYGSGMAFLKKFKDIEIAEIVLCNRVWIRNGFFKNCEGNRDH
ncbi:F-box/LRR-repeat protein 25 [Carex littledalei]|uniref:F-box/LRR-repeat protein 25 n=1 Tax=Carex littledalei TaxID=544730 RepID=A0A833RC57_9POAL|nr:F-box/LRR-repeat protein 25 [Carex littledalei]